MSPLVHGQQRKGIPSVITSQGSRHFVLRGTLLFKIELPWGAPWVFQNREFRKPNTIQRTWFSAFIASGSEPLWSAGPRGIGRLDAKGLKSHAPHRLCFCFRRWLQKLPTSLEFDSHLRSAYCPTSHITYPPFLAVECEPREVPTATPHQKGIHYLESGENKNRPAPMEIHLPLFLPFAIHWETPAIPVVFISGYGGFHSHSHWNVPSEVHEEAHEIQERNNMSHTDLGEQQLKTDSQRPLPLFCRISHSSWKRRLLGDKLWEQSSQMCSTPRRLCRSLQGCYFP